MLAFLLLIPATMLTVAGYLALYLSHRSEGAFRTFGRYLGFWAFTLAGLVVLGGIVAASRHQDRMWGPGMMHRDGQHMQRWAPPPGAVEPQPAPAGVAPAEPPADPATPPKQAPAQR